ncbi:MAG: B12-binding domain-containing radical SAM protein [Candidatus Scalinduaceae bacterium]
MKKVLLLNPPGDDLHQRDGYCSVISKANYYFPPLDLLVLSGWLYLRFEVVVLDAIVCKTDRKECLCQIDKIKYDAIIFLTGTSSYQEDFDFMGEVKDRNPKTLLLASGGFLLFEGRKVMEENLWLDGIILDFTNDDTVRYLSHDLQGLRNFIYRNGHTIVEKRTKVADEVKYPLPRHELFPLNEYRMPHGRFSRFTRIISSWGCPFKCTFCVYSSVKFRIRSVSDIIQEMRHISSLGIKSVYFMDPTFTADIVHARELCRRMIEDGIELSWVCETRVDRVDKDLLGLMKRAGCYTIQFGIESSNLELLQDHRKAISHEQTRKVFALCKELQIRTLGHFILGLPDDTEESIKDTIRFAIELDCDYAAFNIAAPIIGTRMREEAIASGFTSAELTQLDSSHSYPLLETNKLSRERLWQLRNYAIRRFHLRPYYLFKRTINIESFFELENLLRLGTSLLKSTLKTRVKDG